MITGKKSFGAAALVLAVCFNVYGADAAVNHKKSNENVGDLGDSVEGEEKHRKVNISTEGTIIKLKTTGDQASEWSKKEGGENYSSVKYLGIQDDEAASGVYSPQFSGISKIGGNGGGAGKGKTNNTYNWKVKGKYKIYTHKHEFAETNSNGRPDASSGIEEPNPITVPYNFDCSLRDENGVSKKLGNVFAELNNEGQNHPELGDGNAIFRHPQKIVSEDINVEDYTINTAICDKPHNKTENCCKQNALQHAEAHCKPEVEDSKLTILFPEWNQSEDGALNADAKREWNNFTTALKDHEMGHYEIFKVYRSAVKSECDKLCKYKFTAAACYGKSAGGVNKAKERVEKMIEDQSAKDIQDINERVGLLMNGHESIQDEYDIFTKHGQNQTVGFSYTFDNRSYSVRASRFTTLYDSDISLTD